MPETMKFMNDGKDYFLNNFNHKFLFVNNISDFKELHPEIELCIIKTDFKKSDLNFIKKLKETNKNTEFWISSNNLSRDNIFISNKIGIKTVISSPINYKMVEEFFMSKNNSFYSEKVFEKEYDCSCISNSKVMIVDDNKMNVELLEDILSNLGLKISSYLKPKEAYEVALNENFDLFLLDIMMPEMSGFELSKKIRNTPLNKGAQMVFISALSDSRSKIKSYDLGSVAYIEKPFDINVVKSQIFNLLKTKKNQDVVNSAKESFLATVAHDLKTPIYSEINALNLLLNENFGELKETQQEIIGDILDSTKFMKNMVENLLCKNKIENNKITISKQVYSLQEVVKNCVELTKYILNQKCQKIEVKCNVDNTLLPFDFLEMTRVVNNLIANASEYSPTGGKILIEIFEKANKIGLYVQDFGKGIDLEEQKDIFSKYASYAKKYKKVGSGLGLYITKEIIELHGGEIMLESKVGSGTKVTFLLPNYIKE